MRSFEGAENGASFCSGSTVEIVSGLQPSDAVILDPADSLISGTPV